MTGPQYIKPTFHKWAQHARRLGFQEFVTPEDAFTTELSTNEDWTNHSACGIYTWITENGDAYVGQAIKVKARLRQHWKNHRTMAYAAFQPIGRDVLDVEEPKLIAAMESAIPILNIAFAKSSTTTVPFDEIVTERERQDFFNNGQLTEYTNWPEWPLLLRKQAGKFDVLQTDDLYCIVLQSIRIFIERCIPKPRSTEVKFWSVTIHNDSSLYFRINVGQQEVITLWQDEQRLWARVLTQDRREMDADGPFYVTKSFANMVAFEKLSGWLAGDNLMSARSLVIWLMRHTVPIHSRSHCPQLVRAAFAAPTPSPC